MKRLVISGFILAFAQAHAAIPKSPDGLQEGPKIRVRIAKSKPSVRLRGVDLRVYDLKGAARSLAAQSADLTEWKVECRNARINARPVSNHGQVRKFSGPVLFESPAGFLSVDGRGFREQMVLIPRKKGCDLVNHVELEEYLDGLVNAEFSASWNEEAVQAQIIAARTYAFYQMQQARRKGAIFDVESTVKDQVYDGSGREHFLASRNVDRTRGMILTTGSDHPSAIKAFYHSTCGGKTALPQQVWGQKYPAFTRRVICPYCKSSPKHRWTLELSRKEIERAIREGLGSGRTPGQGPRPGQWPTAWINAVRKGRARLLSLHTDSIERGEDVVTIWSATDSKKNHRITLSAHRFRNWIGPVRLPSTAFQVSALKGDRWKLSGRGYGHGVGMCQWGAKVMGERGFNMANILKFYYPGAVLKKVWQ